MANWRLLTADTGLIPDCLPPYSVRLRGQRSQKLISGFANLFITVASVTDQNHHDGKQDCLQVFPYDVSKVIKWSPHKGSGLSIIDQLKFWVHEASVPSRDEQTTDKFDWWLGVICFRCGDEKLIYYVIKIAITTILIVAISEVSKRNSLVGAVLASIPLVSVLAMFWLYIDTNDPTKVSNLSSSIFWLVLPSLTLFLTLPLLLRLEFNFYFAITISIGLTVLCYLLMLAVLNYFGVKL